MLSFAAKLRPYIIFFLSFFFGFFIASISCNNGLIGQWKMKLVGKRVTTQTLDFGCWIQLNGPKVNCLMEFISKCQIAKCSFHWNCIFHTLHPATLHPNCEISTASASVSSFSSSSSFFYPNSSFYFVTQTLIQNNSFTLYSAFTLDYRRSSNR